MIKNTILVLLLFIVFSSNAQKKILFDNTKSETAGNADWIIDTSEPIPTPAQSGITSSTLETYWKGGISAWGVEMAKRGFTIETLPYYSSITYGTSASQDLSNYDVFVVCEPNNQFLWSEKTAIMNFVKNGGGLFMVADHENADRDNDGWDAYAAWRDLITNNSVQNNAFGMIFDVADYINDYPCYNTADNTSDPLLHGVAGNVNAMEFHGSAAMSINTSNNSTVKAAVYQTGYSNTGTTHVMVAYAKYGQGRVVGLVDSSPADDGTGDSGDDLYYGWGEQDNGILITNATLWLAEDNVDIKDVENDFITLYPNPANNIININLKNISLPVKYSIIDITGKNYLSGFFNKGQNKINLNKLKKGIYFIKINSSDKNLVNTIILK